MKNSISKALVSQHLRRGLLASASLIAMSVTGAAFAQTVVNDGDNTPVVVPDNTAATVAAGVTSTVNNVTLITVNNDSSLTNAGTLLTTGTGTTVVLAGDASTVTNNGTGVLGSGSRVFLFSGSLNTLVNDGLIQATANQLNGTVFLSNTANVNDITNNGTIDASGFEGSGITISLDPTELNLNTITNDGVISGSGQAGAGSAAAGDGIRIETLRGSEGQLGVNTGTFDGEITNSGLIDSDSDQGTTAGFRAVNGVNFQGTLTNTASGVISGVRNGVYFGTGDDTGGAFINNGIVTSDSRAVNIDGTGLTVTNTGSILGTGDQRNGTFYLDNTSNGVSVNNSGTIDAGAGNQGAGISHSLSTTDPVTTTITNSGTITGRGTASAALATAGDGIRLETQRDELGQLGANTGTFTGSITNSGTITSEGDSGTTAGFRSVNGVNFEGTLTNTSTGTISGVQNGVYFGTGRHNGGSFVNNGTVSSDSRALNIGGSALDVTNTGTILGTGDQRNGTVFINTTSLLDTAENITLNNSGSIDAGVGNQGAGVSLSLEIDVPGGFVPTNVTTTITNSGTITGRGTAGAATALAGDGIRIETARGSEGQLGVSIGVFVGSVTNSGTITSEGNSGTTAGFRAVNGVNFQGTLTNTSSGTISGVQNGVYFGTGDDTGGSFINNGTVTSDSRALNVDGTGLTITNTGTIAATGDQRNGTVSFDDTATDYTLDNSGTINGAGFQAAGISISLAADGSNSGAITNSGLIAGSGQASAGSALAGDGIRIETARGSEGQLGVSIGVFVGSVTNSGTITSEGNSGTTAGFRAVNGVNFQGTLTNTSSGTISGVQNGVYFGTGDDTGGSFINNGTVTSDSRALNVDGTGLTITNTGTIAATGDQRNGTV
ncbi:MAG: hypothetical protein JKY60_16010, partial [Kordiimonadaceae bacterium]|nr:hypothetical protein [Kordiimonadaceae bacterium]